MKIVYAVITGFLLCICGTTSSAQVAVGTPPFATYGGGPDIIDLANLNVRLDIPIVRKPGRGLDFDYDVTYDSSVWTPVTSGSTQAWQFARGWSGVAQSSVNYKTTATDCYKNIGGGRKEYLGTWYSYTNWTYKDTSGNVHPFTGAAAKEYEDSCPLAGEYGDYWYGFTATATDGSGFVLTVGSGNSPTYGDGGVTTVTAVGGTLVYNSNGDTPEDTNGNFISFNGNEYTDTLGQTALTISTPNPPNNTTYTYPAPSGGNATYTMKYAQLTVQTNFQCSGISEFGPTPEYLVSEIDLPDYDPNLNPSARYVFTYEPTPSHSGSYTGRIASITFPTGGTMQYVYPGDQGYTGGLSAANNGIVCSDGSTAGFMRYTPDTGSNYWNYAHSESGTAWTTAMTDPEGNRTNLNFQGIYVTEEQFYQGTSTLLKTAYSCYNGGGLSNCNPNGVTPPITQQNIYIQWPGSGDLESETSTSYNSYGLATEVVQLGYGNGSPGLVVSQLLINYATLGNGIVNRPSSVTVEDGSDAIKAQTTYCYDEATPSGTATCNTTGNPVSTSGTPQNYGWSGSRGNPTTIAYLVSGSKTLAKTFTYYDTGNIYTATDVNGAQTIYVYGSGTSCGNSFATSINEPLLPSKSMTWNCSGGVETSVIDENGNTSSIAYTNAYYWRPDSATDQLSNQTSFSYTPSSAETALPFNSNNSVSDSLVTVDGLGRTHVSQVSEGPSSGTWDSVEADYDSLGRLDRTTLPYATTGRGATNGSAPSMLTTYDPLGRKTQVTNSGGLNVTYAYNQNDALQTLGPAPSGENTKQRQYEYDALGRLTSVCEVTSASGSGSCGQTNAQTGYWTQYSYDANGDLTGVTQNAQSSPAETRTYFYDDLGRITETNDPESGVKFYYYDQGPDCNNSYPGDLAESADADRNVVCYSYDALHRRTSVTYAQLQIATPNQYFVYDASSVNGTSLLNTKAQLSEAYTCMSYACPSTKLTDMYFSYDKRGGVTDSYESTPDSGGYYHLSESYWANGLVNQLSGIPGVPTITYNADGKGRVCSVSASSGQNPLSTGGCTAYNPADQVIQVGFGSSDSDSFLYDQYTNLMKQYQFTVNGSSVVGSLTWNSNGSLNQLTISDPFNSGDTQACTYMYDDLGRIAGNTSIPGVNCMNGSQTVWAQTFSYDAFGNISKSGSESFQPTYTSNPPTNQIAEVGGTAPQYDADGNVKSDPLNTYTWDASNKPVVIDGTDITYNALGQMVEQTLSGAYTEVLYAPDGSKVAFVNGSTLSKAFIALPAGAAAVYTASGLDHYRHSDWLGSSRLASTAQSPTSVSSDIAYAPFGETYASSGAGEVSFTGMNQDTASNVYDFPAREYSIQGRWPSPDPAGFASADPTDPQTWNQYAYVRNSPLTAIDPTGMDSIVYGPCGPHSCQTKQIELQAEIDAQRIENLTGWEEFSLFDLADALDNTVKYQETLNGPEIPIYPNVDPLELPMLSQPLHVPWVLSWIVPLTPPVPLLVGVGPAGDVEWNPDTHNICVGVGIGASGGHSVAVGPLTNGKMFNGQQYPAGADNILSGWSISGGYNMPVPVPLGVQMQVNNSGVAAGPTIGEPGASVAVTDSACVQLPF